MNPPKKYSESEVSSAFWKSSLEWLIECNITALYRMNEEGYAMTSAYHELQLNTEKAILMLNGKCPSPEKVS